MIQRVATRATVLALQGVTPSPSAWLVQRSTNRDPSPIVCGLMAPWLPIYATSSMKMTKSPGGFSRRLVWPPRLRPIGTPLMRSSRCTRLLIVTCLLPLMTVQRQALLTRSLRTLGKQAHPVLKYRVPHGSQCVMSRPIHTGLGSSSLIAHVLHSPPPPPRTDCNRSCSNKHTHSDSADD